MEIRSFLAFELPDEFKKILFRVSQEMRNILPNVKWVKVDNIHLTMVFMGNMGTEDLSRLSGTVGVVCHEYRPFKVSLKGAGFFGARRHPRVLWLRVDGDIERMSYFRDSLQEHLKPFGIKEEERRFRPHLTLGRFRKGSEAGSRLEKLLAKYEDLTSAVCSLEELVLFRSDLRPGGAVYTRLNDWPLAGSL